MKTAQEMPRPALQSFSILASLLAWLASSPALASGYNIGTQSVSAQGTANANGAEALDASTLYANPAGMMNLQGTQFSLTGSYVMPDVTFTPTGTPTANVGGTLFPITGTGGGEPIDNTFIPHVYLTHRLNDDYALGLAVFVPFGADTEYDDDFAGRYYTLKTELTTVNINPSFAVKVEDRHYFGFGLALQYMDGSLARKVYGPSIAGGIARQLALAGQITPLQAQTLVAGAVAANADSSLDPRFQVEGDDWGFGFNLGYMFHMNDVTRLGLAWRSRISHELEGDAILTETENIQQFLLGPGGLPPAALSGINTRADGKVALETPESASFNIFHQLNEKWALMSDLTWTKHSRLQQIVVEAQPITTTHLQTDWHTTIKFSLGASWQMTPPFQLRVGYQYDESPVESTLTVLPTLPDNDRQWFSVGGRYQINQSNTLDFAYSYITIRDQQLDRRFGSQINADVPNNAAPDGQGSSSGTVTGNFDSSAQIVGVQWNMAF
jgi:long-chain fatty acid transport protein